MKINIVNIPIFHRCFPISAVKIVGFATKNKNEQIKLITVTQNRPTTCIPLRPEPHYPHQSATTEERKWPF